MIYLRFEIMKNKIKEFEIYNHIILWAAAEKSLELCSSSKSDAGLARISTILLFFFAFEGYLNWLGARIALDVWQDERVFFSRKPYQGTLGKYIFLVDKLQLPRPDTGCGEYKTAIDVLHFRDMIVHPKSESGKQVVKVTDGNFPKAYLGKIQSTTSGLVDRAVKDLKILSERLHIRAKETYPFEVHESKAFGSIFGLEVTSL